MAASKKKGGTVFIQGVEDAKEKFKEHLERCFWEYLFLKDEEQALFFLGIALHGIMDSFTPSHMNFQPYAIQNGRLHAQGDVLPFRGETVRFIPGQYSNDAIASHNKSMLAAFVKGYNDDDDIGREFEMFKIFVAIGGLEKNAIIESILNGEIEITENKTVNDGFTVLQVPYVSKKRLNAIIKDIKYDESAFKLSDTAIQVVVDVFKHLCLIRNQEGYNYKKYKVAKKNIGEVVRIWEKKYDALESIRNDLLRRIKEVRGIDKDNTKNPFEK